MKDLKETVSDEELWERLFDAKCEGRDFEAYATLAQDVTLPNGPAFKAGERMRVVMVSRMGDVGLTRDLSKTHGYELRITCHDEAKASFGMTEPWLKDCEVVRG